MLTWFADGAGRGWATCPLTESGFVRVSSNRAAVPSPVGTETARGVLRALCTHPAHSFVVDDVSLTDGDVPAIAGHRQVTDAHLLTLARRRGARVLTFDAGMLALAGGSDADVELLRAL